MASYGLLVYAQVLAPTRTCTHTLHTRAQTLTCTHRQHTPNLLTLESNMSSVMHFQVTLVLHEHHRLYLIQTKMAMAS